MSDRGAVVLAGAVVAGAWWAAPVPVAPALVAVVGALVTRRVWALVPAATVLAAGLAAQAWAGLGVPAAGPVDGWATVTRDPGALAGAVRVELRLDGRRYEAWARGRAAGALADRMAGEHVHVVGRVERSLPPSHLRARHVAGRLTVSEVRGWRPGHPVHRLANGFRLILSRGVAHLPDRSRVLFTGFVLGDDRGQAPEVADDFRGSGLTHLLVVSGQNVAFVLAVVAPLAGRLGPRARLVALLAVLGGFALLTRFEPSVLRATAMAAVATVAAVSGRPVSGVRTLALAVAGVVLVDPLLVHSLGFGLSVAASAGILLLARPLLEVLPGPGWLARPLSVTLAAQVGVTPLLVQVTGGIPLATVPANLLAEPVAGFVMMWGLAAGTPAGLLGGPAAAVLHLPTGLALAWIASVARVAARLPLGVLTLPGVALAAAGGAGAVLAARRDRPGLARAAIVGVAVLAVGLAQLDRPGPPAPVQELAPGAVLVSGGGGAERPVRVLVLRSSARPSAVLAELRRLEVDRVDVVASVHGSRRAAELVASVRARVRVGQVWAPPGAPVPGAVTPSTGGVDLGGLRVWVRARAPTLEVEVVPPS
jgi:competence protein ComEC